MKLNNSLKGLDVELLGQKLPGSPEVRAVFLGWLKNLVEKEGEEYIRRCKGFLLAETESLQSEVAALPRLLSSSASNRVED